MAGKQPLYRTGILKQILADHNPGMTPEDILCLYTLSGGVPKYVSLLMDNGAFTRDAM